MMYNGERMLKVLGPQLKLQKQNSYSFDQVWCLLYLSCKGCRVGGFVGAWEQISATVSGKDTPPDYLQMFRLRTFTVLFRLLGTILQIVTLTILRFIQTLQILQLVLLKLVKVVVLNLSMIWNLWTVFGSSKSCRPFR